jgi:hypothetical protein
LECACPCLCGEYVGGEDHECIAVEHDAGTEVAEHTHGAVMVAIGGWRHDKE